MESVEGKKGRSAHQQGVTGATGGAEEYLCTSRVTPLWGGAGVSPPALSHHWIRAAPGSRVLIPQCIQLP